MNLKLTVAAGLLAAMSGAVLAQGTINTNNFVSNTKASNTKASNTKTSQSYFTPTASKSAKKNRWKFSYNGSIGYGHSEDTFGDEADNLTPIGLGLSVQRRSGDGKGGFFAGVLGNYESSELDTDIDTGYVYKLSKAVLLGSDLYHTISSNFDEDNTTTSNNGLQLAGAWNGLGLMYDQDFSETDNEYGAFYMKSFGKKSYFNAMIMVPTDNPDDIMHYSLAYDYKFRQDYRVGVEYDLDTAKDTPDASTWYVTLSKGLDFDGITDAMRHYM